MKAFLLLRFTLFTLGTHSLASSVPGHPLADTKSSQSGNARSVDETPRNYQQMVTIFQQGRAPSEKEYKTTISAIVRCFDEENPTVPNHAAIHMAHQLPQKNTKSSFGIRIGKLYHVRALPSDRQKAMNEEKNTFLSLAAKGNRTAMARDWENGLEKGNDSTSLYFHRPMYRVVGDTQVYEQYFLRSVRINGKDELMVFINQIESQKGVKRPIKSFYCI